MLKKLWLLFAQSVTVVLAVVLVLLVAAPQWLPEPLRGAQPHGPWAKGPTAPTPEHPANILSYAGAAQRAIPAVVNIYSVSLERPRSARPGEAVPRRSLSERAPERQNASTGPGCSPNHWAKARA